MKNERNVLVKLLATLENVDVVLLDCLGQENLNKLKENEELYEGVVDALLFVKMSKS